MPTDRNADIYRLATSQRGLVTRAQLLRLGMASNTISRRIASGRWERVHQGVYRVWELEPPLQWAHAGLLAAGPRSALSHDTSALLRGWLGDPEPHSNRVVHLVVEARGPRPRPGLIVHRVARLDADERDRHGDLPTTSIHRTLLDLAATRTLHELERIVARAQRAKLLTMGDLHTAIERYSGRRGVGALRTLASLAGGPAFTRSEAEERFLHLVREAQLPPPRTNERVGRWECDFVWVSERVVIEIDGYSFHRGRNMFESDRAKDGWLQSQGFAVLRFTWRQLAERPIKAAVQVAQTLARGAPARRTQHA